MTAPQIIRQAKRRTDERNERRDLRLIGAGIIGADRIDGDDAREYADAIGFAQLCGEQALGIDSIGEHRRAIEQDADLSDSGRQRKRLLIGTAAMKGAAKLIAPTVDRIVRDLTAAIESEARTGAEPVTLADVVRDFGGSTRTDLNGTFLGADVANRLQLVRQQLAELATAATGNELRAIIGRAIDDGDSLTIAGIDTAPSWLRDRLLGTAGIDADTWSRHRRTYRIKRNPKGAGRLAAMVRVGQLVNDNALAMAAAIERAGLHVEREEAQAFDALLGRLRAAIARASA